MRSLAISDDFYYVLMAFTEIRWCNNCVLEIAFPVVSIVFKIFIRMLFGFKRSAALFQVSKSVFGEVLLLGFNCNLVVRFYV